MLLGLVPCFVQSREWLESAKSIIQRPGDLTAENHTVQGVAGLCLLQRTTALFSVKGATTLSRNHDDAVHAPPSAVVVLPSLPQCYFLRQGIQDKGFIVNTTECSSTVSLLFLELFLRGAV